MSKNTRLDYMYRDGDNYKTHATVVFSGPLTLEMRDRIGCAGIEGDPDADNYGFFIPGQVGLPDLQNRFNTDHLPLVEEMLRSSSKDAGPVRTEIDPAERARLVALRDEMAETTPKWDPDRDHPVHEITDVHLTDMAPTDARSIEEFTVAMEATEWDMNYRPPFHAEMLANFENDDRSNADDPEPT